MAAKKKNPAARKAQKNARRATRKRNSARTPQAPRFKTLYDLSPPGAYYQEWEKPRGGDPETVMSMVSEAYGADSGEAATMRLMLRYRDIYGPHVPFAAAGQLDLLLDTTDLADQVGGSLLGAEDDVRDTVHRLHAQGLLLIDDDGSLWTTIPPGTPYSAPDGQWAFTDQKVVAPQLTA
ncbi:hypothetical protein ACWIG4_27255 [Streptomyces sp. NPDC002248]